MAVVDTTTELTKDGQRLRIRTAEASDTAWLSEHMQAAAVESIYNHYAPEENLLTPRGRRIWINRSRAEPDQLFILAEFLEPQRETTKPLGQLYCRAQAGQRLRHNAEFGISVEPAHRDKGIGRALLETLLTWARHHDHIERITLGVLANNARAIALYTKLGFQTEAQHPKAVKISDDNYLDEISMAIRVKP